MQAPVYQPKPKVVCDAKSVFDKEDEDDSISHTTLSASPSCAEDLNRTAQQQSHAAPSNYEAQTPPFVPATLKQPQVKVIGDATSVVDKEDGDDSFHTESSASLLYAEDLNRTTQQQAYAAPSHYEAKNPHVVPAIVSNTGTKERGGTSAVTKEDEEDEMEQEVRSMNVSTIKSELESLGISMMSFIEKGELTDALLRARRAGRKSGAALSLPSRAVPTMPAAPPMVAMTTADTTAYNAPKKYVLINEVMKLNPEYKRWQDSTGVGTATSLPNLAQALPVVTCLEDYIQLKDDLGTNILLAESTDATIEMIQDQEFSADVGMNPDTMVNVIGDVLSKYEVPVGLTNKVRPLPYHAPFPLDRSNRSSSSLL